MAKQKKRNKADGGIIEERRRVAKRKAVSVIVRVRLDVRAGEGERKRCGESEGE